MGRPLTDAQLANTCHRFERRGPRSLPFVISAAMLIYSAAVFAAGLIAGAAMAGLH